MCFSPQEAIMLIARKTNTFFIVAMGEMQKVWVLWQSNLFPWHSQNRMENHRDDVYTYMYIHTSFLTNKHLGTSAMSIRCSHTVSRKCVCVQRLNEATTSAFQRLYKCIGNIHRNSIQKVIQMYGGYM